MPSHSCVLVGHSGGSEGDNVTKPLDLVDDRVGIRHFDSVVHGGLARLSYDKIDLCVNFVFREEKNTSVNRFFVYIAETL